MRRTLITVTTLALAAGGALLAAAPAQAAVLPDPVLISPAGENQVWFQSFQRDGKDAPCVAPASLDIAWQSDWPATENAWTPSWEKWPNGGTGGWTCTRQITWANGAPAVYEILF
jgi:hypothetical protein